MPAAPSTLEPTGTAGGEASQYVVDCAALAFAPPDTRQPPEWAQEFIQLPNSARGTKRFYRSTYPMMNEPLCRSVDPRVRRLVVMAPTGGGKTTMFDVRTPYAIANSIGSVLIAMQSDPDADDYCEKRLNKILDSCPPVVALRPVGPKARHLIKQNSRTYQELTLDVGGPGKSNRQRKSVQWVGIDEAWLVEYGAILEFEARLHDRWNGQLCVVSQGAEQKVADQRIELDEYWQTTDQAELHWRCPRCQHVQAYWWDLETKRFSLRYDVARKENGSVDYAATAATARLVCENPSCPDPVFTDTYENRRALAESLDGSPEQYQPTATPEKEGYCGRHYNALAMYWVPWAKLAVEWLRAVDKLKDGDPTPMLTFVTKRLARTYWLPKRSAATVLTAANYKLADYWEPGTRIEGEAERFMAIDVQQGHWWVLVRALRANGTSRLLYAEKVSSEQMLVHLQERFQVKPGCVLVDCNYEPGLVFNLCAHHGWTAVEGDKSQGFPQTVVGPGGKRRLIYRYYSRPNPTAAPEGGVCQRILFSRVKVTDEAVKLRDNPASGWEHGEDTPADWHKHVVAEEKIESRGEGGKPTFRYERIKGRRNDLWWCEVAVVLGAIILRFLKPTGAETPEGDAVDSPAAASEEASSD